MQCYQNLERQIEKTIAAKAAGLTKPLLPQVLQLWLGRNSRFTAKRRLAYSN